MAYLPPSVILRQEFLALNSSASQPLNACLVGPNCRVFSYDNALDKPLIALGAYDSAEGGVFAYPSIPDGGVVDPARVSLVLEDVLAQFASISGSTLATRSSTVSNKITLGVGADGAFQENDSSDRLSALGERDLAIGDRIKITGATSGTTITTRIQGFGRTAVAASAGSFSAGSGNQAAQTKNVAVTTVTANGDHAATEYTAGGVYVGDLSLGVVSDTYTLTCTTGGVGTAAVFQVTSLKGDDVTSVTAPALAGHIAVGARGLAVTLSGTGAYVVGEKYSFVVRSAVVAQTPSIVVNGYTGGADTAYQIKVLKGGKWSEGPVISVSTLNGVDYQSPQTIAYNTSFPLGTLGVTAKFNTSTTQDGLLANDVYLVAIVAASSGAVTSLYTSDPLPSGITTSENLAFVFYLFKESVAVAPAGYPFTGSLALDVGDEEVTVSPNLEIADAQFTDSLGGLVALPVISANLYLNYSALLTAEAGVFQTISDLSSVEPVLGRVEAGNPLAYAVYKALLNSAGQAVNFVAVGEDSLSGYEDALATLEKNEIAYFCVPTSDDLEVRQLFLAHALAMSNPSVALERIALGGCQLDPTLSLYDVKSDASHWTAYVALNPDSAVSVYTKLTMPGAAFLTDGVRAGDQVRTDYALDASGAMTYRTARVARVLDNQNLLLAGTGFGAAVGSSGAPVRTAIVRALTRPELAAQAASRSGAFSNRRYFSVLPNRDPNASVAAGAEPLWAYAAMVAGAKSGVAPHQGITNLVLNGVTENLQYFTPAQMNVIAAGGTLILAQDSPGGAVYVRHQLSSDMTDANTQEMSIAVNDDAIIKFVRADLKPFLGRWNQTEAFIQQVYTIVAHKFDWLSTQTVTTTAGPQVTSFDPKDLIVAGDPVTRTLTNLSVDYGLPYPCNNIKGTLRVI